MSKISELSDGGVIQGGDTLIAVRSGGNVKVTYGGSTTANIDGGTIDGTVIGGTTPAAATFTTFTSTGIDDNATSTAITIDASENVGIGSSTGANYRLFAYQNASTGSSSALSVRQDGTDLIARFAGAGDAERMRIDSSGNVGIGNTSPNAKFTNYKNTSVSGASGATLSLELNEEPRLLFTSDSSSSYISSFASNPITFSVTAGNFASSTGTERMRISSSGQLLIGTTSSSEEGAFVATSSGGETAFSFRNNATAANTASSIFLQTWTNDGTQAGVSKISSIKDGTTFGSQLAFYTTTGALGNTTEAMRIDNAGNVGIGTSSPAAKLEINGTTGLLLSSGADTRKAYIKYQGDGALRIGSDAGGTSDTLFFTLGSERARIDASGNLLVGTTASAPDGAEGVKIIPAYHGANKSWTAISTAGYQTETCLSIYSTAVSAFRFYVDAAGTISAVNTTITSLSDERAKENIRDLDDGLAKVMQLQPRKFDWKEGQGKNISNDRGFIAQEFEQVFPDMIEEWKDEAPEGEEPYKAINANLIPTLVKAIQEQQAMIEDLKAEVAALKGAN